MINNKLKRIFILFFPAFIFTFTLSSGADINHSGNYVPSSLRVSTFDIDVTPPAGSHLTYDPMVNSWDLGLRAKGIVLTGAGLPVVLCSVDWIGISNDSHDAFRSELADAAGTVRERVAVHTIHQHDAPVSDFGAERMLREAGMDPGCYESTFQREVIRRLGVVVRNVIGKAQPITHIGFGEAQVYKVASNRRIMGHDGKVRASRWSSCRDSALVAEPEGLIDPMVSLVSFWNEDNPVAVLSYYANHPQSYYRTGVANPDYPGVARFLRQLAVPQALHIHFAGAGGNLTAGKYNDGSKENRERLASRLADGMRRAWEATQKEPLTEDEVEWNFVPVSLPPSVHIENIQAEINTMTTADLANDLSKLVWIKRLYEGKMLDVGCLTLGRIRILHMPGELFVEYQLAAKNMRPDLIVAMAAYGDYAPGYICTAKAYEENGYEDGPASGVTAGAEEILMDALRKLLQVK